MRLGPWDQGTEMAEHASVTVAADLLIYFAHPRSPWGAAHEREHQRSDPRVPAQRYRDHLASALPSMPSPAS